MNEEETDALLEKLSQEYGVPKPQYIIARYKITKKLKRILIDGDIKGFHYPRPTVRGEFNADFNYITLVGSERGVRKHDVIHEFFHYYHFIKNEVDNEELVERETRRYMRKGKREVVAVFFRH